MVRVSVRKERRKGGRGGKRGRGIDGLIELDKDL